MRPLRDAAIYGSLAFGLGFLFGALRELVLIPWLGPDGAVVEFVAVTATVVLLGARLARGWPGAPPARLARGLGGVAVLLALESGLALLVLGQSVGEYLQGFDVSGGSLFPLGLAAMAVAPLLARRA